MTCHKITAKLPKKVIQKLISCEGVVLRKGSLVNVIGLVNSAEGQLVYKTFLADDSEEVDPLLNPSFGNPLYPYVPHATQVEVYNLLSTFQPLDAASIFAGGFAFIPAVFPIPGGFQYHHAKIAIQAVQQEIQTVGIFAAQCPGLSALLSGQVICDLTITYGNVVIETRIHKV